MYKNLDQNQQIVWQHLTNLNSTLSENQQSNFALRFFAKLFGDDAKKTRSIYIYGGVGRGKSMMMRHFYESCTTLKKNEKCYFHFNSFMKKLHETLRDIRKKEATGLIKSKDHLIDAVKSIIGDAKLLCFDEFQVVDIADAMLLGRIFSHLFSSNVVVVFTSNLHPLSLYPNGLQRELFLEFVNKILMNYCQIIHLNSAIDYRALYRKNLDQRYFLDDENGKEKIKEIIKNLTKSQPLKTTKVISWGREIKLKKTFSDIAIISFNDLCNENYSASDYNAICQNFALIFLTDLERINSEDNDVARRFVLFIDEVYENKVALIISAKIAIEEIYPNGKMREIFSRTISRLQEIKSDYYWQGSKINAQT